jgi:hypothetical protein
MYTKLSRELALCQAAPLSIRFQTIAKKVKQAGVHTASFSSELILYDFPSLHENNKMSRFYIAKSRTEALANNNRAQEYAKLSP